MRIADFQLERYFARWEFAVPHLLCASDVEALSMSEILSWADDETRALWNDLHLGYTESTGHPLLRAEIAALYQGVAPDDVLVCAGAEEAIFLTVSTRLAPGDHAVVVWPAYQSLFEVARACGAEVSLLPLRHENGWALDTDELRRLLRPNTRLVAVNFPHNPTGAACDEGTFAAVAAIARGAGAHLLSDEVYRYLEHDPTRRLPAGVELGEVATSIGVMSKSFALAGLRIGWIATRDRAALARAAALKDYTTICSSAPSEVLALIALRAKERVLARSRDIVATNLRRLDRFFDEYRASFAWVRPTAGSVGFPRLTADVAIEAFAEDLARTEGVLLLPGSVFGHGGNHFRIGFGRRDMPEAIERLERYVRRTVG